MPKEAKKFTIMDRTEMLQALRKGNPSFLTSSDIDTGRVIPLTHADIEILGHLEESSDSFSLKLEIRRIKKLKTLATLATPLPASSESKAQASTVLSTSEYAEAEAIGYTLPGCIHCPAPPYSDAAFYSRAEGPVMLSVIIEPDGRAHDIAIAKHLQADLDHSAIATVGQWTLNLQLDQTENRPPSKCLLKLIFT